MTVIADDNDCRFDERSVSCASHAQSAAMFSRKYSRKKKAQWRFFLFLNILKTNWRGYGSVSPHNNSSGAGTPISASGILPHQKHQMTGFNNNTQQG